MKYLLPIIRKDFKDFRRSSGFSGYRTFISNFKNHFIVDTCYTIDYGNESMVFACDKNGKITEWNDLYCKRGFSTKKMETVHNEIVEMWIKKIESENE